MLKHIVMFRFTEATNIQDRLDKANELSRIFSPLSSLSCVSEFRCGINFNRAPHAWDFIIDSVFENHTALEEYQVSREHQEAIKRASYIKKEKAVVDFLI